jgi:organic hydroperoxide reductase OsmC/OhrA
MDDTVPAGPPSSRIRIRIAAEGVDPQRLLELVEWADHYSPISDLIRRAVPVTVEVETAVGELS